MPGHLSGASRDDFLAIGTWCLAIQSSTSSQGKGGFVPDAWSVVTCCNHYLYNKLRVNSLDDHAVVGGRA